MLAVSDESEEKVSAYVDEMGVRVRCAAGFSSGDKWGVSGYPSAVLINAQGEISWTGHPSSLSSSKVKAALKGAKPRKGGFMSFRVKRELSSKLKSAAAAALDGKLGKAHAKASKIGADERPDASEREDAQVFAGEILDFAKQLRAQAESAIKNRRMLEGLKVLEALEGEFKRTEFGGELTRRLAEIADDQDLQNELAAAQAWAKAMAAVEKRGLKKAAKKFEGIVKKYPGTRAAERATLKLRGI